VKTAVENPKKYLTAIFYASQTPLGVWAGFSFGKGDWLLGASLTIGMMIFEGLAVMLWMDAQTIEVSRKEKESMK